MEFYLNRLFIRCIITYLCLKDGGDENKSRGPRGALRDGVRGRGRPRGRARGYYGRGRGARSEQGVGQEPSEGVQEDGSGESRGGYRGRPFRGRRGGRGRGSRPRSGDGGDGKVIFSFILKMSFLKML